jgi:type VI secretion system protein ImpL
LLKDVVFQEADLAGSNRRLEVQRAWLQKAAYAGAVGVTILAVLAWTTSFTRNQVHVSRFKDRVEDYRQLSALKLNDPAGFDELLPRLEAMREVTDVYDDFGDGTPFLMGMGLYQGASLTAAGNDAYRRELDNILLLAIRNQLEQHLESGVGDPDFQYEGLKTYLMLGDKEHLDPELLALWMDLDWRNTFAEAPDKHGQLIITCSPCYRSAINLSHLMKRSLNVRGED